MIWGYYRDFLLNYNVPIKINHPISSHPHVLITGASGTGKSTVLLYELGILMQTYPTINLYICDFKNSEDFSFLKEYPNFYAGDSCYLGIRKYYEEFCIARRTGNTVRSLLLFDEYPSFLVYLQAKDKLNKTKEATDVLNIVSEILMLGRGVSYGLWIITQRADAAFFQSGSRDNFMITVCLGNTSKEQRQMLFSSCEVPNSIYQRGEGLLLADGTSIAEVKFPMISNVERWRHGILQTLCTRR